jgi:hypothetical protein
VRGVTATVAISARACAGLITDRRSMGSENVGARPLDRSYRFGDQELELDGISERVGEHARLR